MQALRMLVSTSTILAASAVAWAQDPGSKPKSVGPGATLQYRITVNQTKEATPAKPTTSTDATKAETRRVRFIRAQEPVRDAAKGQSTKADVNVRVQEPDNAEILHRVLRLSEGKANDPHREVVMKLRAVANESCVQCHTGGVTVRNDDALGLSVVPADETLRSQLKLDGKGLVVTSVEHGSSGDAGGVKEKDIVIALAGKSVATVDEFQKWLKESGVGAAEGRRVPIVVKVVRAGEAKEVRVPPPGAPSLKVGAVKYTTVRRASTAPSWWIGVAVGEVDETLRAHLKLENGTGLVLTDVIKESPAEKVGLKKNDILLSVDHKPVKALNDLSKAVQAAKDEATLALAVRRAGDKLEVSVRPEKRKETEVATTFAPLQGIQEFTINEQPQAWVTQVMPLLNDNLNHQLNWITPGQPGQMYLWTQPNPGPGAATFTYPPVQQPLAGAEKKAVEDQLMKAIEAVNRQVNTLYEKQATLSRTEAADLKVATDLLKKAAAPPETLARIDAQLKALEAQVGDIKRTMDELKSAIKKDPR